MRGLQNEFPFLLPSSLKKVATSNNFHFYPTHKLIKEALKPPEDCSKEDVVRDTLTDQIVFDPELNPWLVVQLGDIHAKFRAQSKKRKRTIEEVPLRLDDPNFKMEFEWIKKKKRKEIEEMDLKLAKQLNEEQALESGALFECGCCYVEVLYHFIHLIFHPFFHIHTML